MCTTCGRGEGETKIEGDDIHHAHEHTHADGMMLLCKTIEALQGILPIVVVEGEQQTSHDAERIRATGAPAVQINTGMADCLAWIEKGAVAVRG